MALYKIIFLGLNVAGPEEETRLREGLQKRFNLTPEKAESLLQRVPIVVKKTESMEEVNRYVKAFEEIGGRVRVEEEPTPLSVNIDIGPIITCPKCGFEQPETDECIKCGIIISKFKQYQKMARSYEGQVREISTMERTVLPWESGEGFIGSFLKTAKEVLFSPTPFFKKVAKGTGFGSPLLFGLLTGIIGFGFSFLWQWLFFSQIIPTQIRSFFPYELYFAFLLIGLPFGLIFSLFVGSGITHLSLLLVSGNRSGFEATFRAIAYSYGAHLFNLIPIIGNLIGSIYIIVLFILGIREGHGISTGRAAIAVLLPAIVVFLLILLAILLPFFIGSLKFFGGVGV
ncbi:MAG: YIP1 family protein [Thermodesulfobacteriota bacterium]